MLPSVDCYIGSQSIVVCLDGLVYIDNSWLNRRCLVIIAVYAPLIAAPLRRTNEFYRELSQLLRSECSIDLVVASNFNAQLRYLAVNKGNIGGRFSIPADRIDNWDRFIVCPDHRLNKRYFPPHQLTWRHPLPSQRLTQTDHIAIGRHWRESNENCRSFWSKPVDLDHDLSRAHCCLRPVGGQISAETTPAQVILDFICSRNFQYDCSLKNMLRIRANTEIIKELTCILSLCCTPCHINLRNDECPRLQLLC